MPWEPEVTIFAAGVGVVSGLVGGFLSFLITNKLKKGQEEADKLQKQLEDRLSPDMNVVRDYEEIAGKGALQDKRWHVNPFWITYVDGVPRIRSWETHSLGEYRLGPNPQRPEELNMLGLVLMEQSVERARQRREWLMFDEIVNSLTLRGFKPCRADEAHLFQELPPERAIK